MVGARRPSPSRPAVSGFSSHCLQNPPDAPRCLVAASSTPCPPAPPPYPGSATRPPPPLQPSSLLLELFASLLVALLVTPWLQMWERAGPPWGLAWSPSPGLHPRLVLQPPGPASALAPLCGPLPPSVWRPAAQDRVVLLCPGTPPPPRDSALAWGRGLGVRCRPPLESVCRGDCCALSRDSRGAGPARPWKGGLSRGCGRWGLALPRKMQGGRLADPGPAAGYRRELGGQWGPMGSLRGPGGGPTVLTWWVLMGLIPRCPAAPGLFRWASLPTGEP